MILREIYRQSLLYFHDKSTDVCDTNILNKGKFHIFRMEIWFSLPCLILRNRKLLMFPIILAKLNVYIFKQERYSQTYLSTPICKFKYIFTANCVKILSRRLNSRSQHEENGRETQVYARGTFSHATHSQVFGVFVCPISILCLLYVFCRSDFPYCTTYYYFFRSK